MSGPKRELPPLVVKILADTAEAVKGLKQVAGTAAKVAKKLIESSKQAQQEITENLEEALTDRFKKHKETYRRMRKLDKAYADEVKKIDKQISDDKKKHVQDIVSFYRTGMQQVLNAEKEFRQQGRLTPVFARGAVKYSKRKGMDLNALAASGQAGYDAGQRVIKQNQAELDRQNKERERQVAETRARLQRVNEQLEAEGFNRLRKHRLRFVRIGRAAQKEQAAIAAAGVIATRRRMGEELDYENTRIANQQKATQQVVQNIRSHFAERNQEHARGVAATNRRFTQELDHELRNQRTRERAQQEAQDREVRLLRRHRERIVRMGRARQEATRELLGRFGGAFNAGSMMGARADMYMHQHALTNMMGRLKGFIAPFTQVEVYTVQMEAFTQSAEKAAAAVAEMQRYAIDSPYNLEGVLDATSTLMKYGQTAESATEITKMMGDIAAGNTEKLRLLALGVSQAFRLGRLTGMELRQMTEHGFNPLVTAAREMVGPGGTDEQIEAQYEKLADLMRRRGVRAGIVKAALQVETSEGGNFAGLSNKMAKTVYGLTQQILETFQLIEIAVVEELKVEIKEIMQVIHDYVTAAVGWVKANREVVKSWAIMLVKVVATVAAFHALSMSIAISKWMLYSLVTVYRILEGAIVIATSALTLFTSAQHGANMAAAMNPYVAVAIAIAAITALILAMTHENGFSGLVADIWNYGWAIAGFFANLQQNISHVFEWIGANWRFMLTDMVDRTWVGVAARMQQIIAGMVDHIVWVFRSLLPAGITEGLAWSFGTVLPKGLADAFATLGISGTVKAVHKKVYHMATGGKQTYDTSMFNLDFINADMFKSIKDALAPFMPENKDLPIPPKPDIDWDKFLTQGESEGGRGAMSARRDHAIRGSSEHAVRMWEYSQQMQVDANAEKRKHEEEMEDLLTRIEHNTRRQGPIGSPVMEANLAGVLV